MDRNKTTELMRNAARRASQHPFFLAADLEEFRTRCGMQKADIAQFLGCAPELLPKLALCRRPDPGSPRFRSDIQRIADAFGLQPARLVQLIRETAALKALAESRQGAGQTGRGLLMAARDAETNESLSEPDPEDNKGPEQGS